jgi:hypothetical protein
MIGQGCFTTAGKVITLALSVEKLFMPQASQREERKQYYG